MTVTIQPALSEEIRTATRAAHDEAENSGFIVDLMNGELPLRAYTAFVVQHHAIYAVLEAAVAEHRNGELADLLSPELDRMPALERDMANLEGSDEIPVLPATRAYADRIVAAAATPEGLLAHHYIRYLGDLSGGQVIGRRMARTYGFEGETATEFYRFPEIDSPKAYKDAYREKLDALDWDADRRARFIAEVSDAFLAHRAIFDELEAL